MERHIRRDRDLSRRAVLAGGAAAGASLAVGVSAPAILAETRAPLRIGMLNIFTGPLTYNGEHNWDGMNLYLEQIGWTIAGRKVELIKEDDQANPQVGLQKVRKLVESDQVDLVCGPQGSNVAMAILNYIKQSGTFLLVSGAGNDAITWERIPRMFRTSISSWQLCHPMGAWVYDNLGKEAVLLGTDFAAGHDTLAEFKAAYTARGGKVLKEIYPPLGTTDFSVYLTDVKAISPPVTYNWFGGTDAIRYVQQYAEAGLKEKTRMVGFAALIDSTSIVAQGRAALGVVTSTIYTDTLETPENKRFVADYRAKYKDYPDLFSEYGYVAARVIDETVKATDGDTADKDKLAAAMAKVTFNAPRGPFRFDPVTHHPIQNVYICEVRDIDGRLANKDIAVIKDVRDPGKKEA
ncbi:MAG TPA: ABC transporter substrate-binding protein [Stellaceae bacterium]|nr:ABC transporter substrate-binding protein [Stellaceae bacterium]